MAATFWVTANCNLNCKYCYEGDNKLNKTMSREVVDRAIDFTLEHFEEENELIVPIHGGEPFLEFEKMKYIVSEFKRKVAKKGKSVIFLTTTNATMINDEIIDFIVKEIPDVTISIDGTKDTHDKMRPFKGGKGSHDIVLKNSIKLLKQLPNMRVRMTFDSDSVDSLYNDVRYVIDLGFKFIVPAPNLFDKNWRNDHVAILENQIRLIKEYIRDRDNVFVSLTDKEDYKVKGPCNGGISSFHIYPDGNLYPCMLTGGNKEFHIGDIFNGIDTVKRDAILSHSENLNPDCDGCKLYSHCSGPRCKIINKLVTGNYYLAPAMHCVLENLQYKINLLEEKI